MILRRLTTIPDCRRLASPGDEGKPEQSGEA